MKLIDPSFEILQPFECNNLIESTKRSIERAGRLAYKSEDKITEDSWDKFFEMLKNKNHLSVFEHGTLYLKIPLGDPTYDDLYYYEISLGLFFKNNPYSRMNIVKDSSGKQTYYITTNFRVIEEHKDILHVPDLLDYLCDPTEYHAKRISVKFICSRGISHELVRHRVFSFIQESQRYVNYSKNGDITFINPEYNQGCYKFEETLKQCEKAYLYLLGLGWKPQEAREVLPNATKTEIIMTGYLSDWEHFFKLRTAKNAHPEMRRLTIPLQKEFERFGYVQ